MFRRMKRLFGSTFLCIFITFNTFKQYSGLTYEKVIEVQTGKIFTPSDLLTLKKEDLDRSILYLGKDIISTEQASAIWKALINAYGEIEAIPDILLQQLGWIAKGIPLQDIGNITLTEIDTIAAFGEYHNLSIEQLSALAQQVHNSWTAKEPEDYTCYDLVALRQIICGFNRTYIERIHPSVYSEASNALGTLKDCPSEIWQGLAGLSTDDVAFGNPESWTPNQVNAAGCVLGGLEFSALSSIPAKSLEFLAPDIAICLSPEHISALTPSQKDTLPSSVISQFSSEQRKALNSQLTFCNINGTDVPCNNSDHITIIGLHLFNCFVLVQLHGAIVFSFIN